ncbi:unnamed protein product [Owenia fusiformis]|uniref:Uncharacterized protein n=1 Tax=Owenia fusiformis TaxID=6347 RepID=A0A8S4N1N7_OWEFU|nr:unnamed protein product [Owenia fusiformis]
MTSLQLFPNVEQKPLVPIEWGTAKLGGNLKVKENIWTPKTPTWQYSGKPIDQHYTLTQLKLSNVRWNDQLLTKPQELDIGKLSIDKPFPAEHPHSSHTSRSAVFPSFANSPEDPKRGVDARKNKPKDAEMPSQPYECTIISKTKGSGLRREIQKLPSEANKDPLVWQGNDNFFQNVKGPEKSQQQLFPSPPKTVIPNLEKRPVDQQVTPKTANALRNIERNQWQTTYDLNHTGIGPLNPLKLDNYDDKKQKYAEIGLIDDKLYPSSVNTFDPPRPFEGRITRGVTPKAKEHSQFDKFQGNPDYIRKMTLTELEEHRLLHGKQYVNLPNKTNPGNKHTSQEWVRTQEESHPDHGLGTLYTSKGRAQTEDIPYKPASAPSPPQEGNYLAPMREAQHDAHQQVEAANRWQVLELHKPHHDLQAMKHKLSKVSGKTQPKVFYNHEGEFTAERAGLYETSYNPYKLANSLDDKHSSTASRMLTGDSHKNALSHPTHLNGEMAALWDQSETQKNPLPNMQEANNHRDVLAPYEQVRDIQKTMLQPNVETADIRVQENGVVLTESTMGESYNSQKFLQENQLSPLIRQEPINLMSYSNQTIDPNVRHAAMSLLKSPPRSSNTGKSVKFNESVEVAVGAGGEPIRLSTASIATPKQTHPVGYSQQNNPPIHQTQPNKLVNENQYQSRQGRYELNQLNSIEENAMAPNTAYISRHINEPAVAENATIAHTVPGTPLRKARPETATNIFASNSTNVAPAGMNKSWEYKTAYMNQFKPEDYSNLNYKTDEAFNYTCGTGLPRPQSNLNLVQDSFSKTKAYKEFHEKFTENNPDLRENIIFGQKHQFYPNNEMNAQVLHDSAPNFHIF